MYIEVKYVCHISSILICLPCPPPRKETKACQIKIIEEGSGVKYTEINSTAFRVRDPHKQLDFIYSAKPVPACSTPGNFSEYHAVQGMEKIMITVKTISTNDTDSPILKNARAIGAFGKTIQITSHLTRAEVEFASHTQYSRDIAMEVSNHLAKEIRNLQCEQRKATHQAVLSTAQYNGWLAATYLDLPICSKLIVVGDSAFILSCAPRNVTFEPVFTTCGPQPRSGDFTINSEGWELTKYSECYWHSSVVNFNGKAHTIRNHTWLPINPNIHVHGRCLIDTMPHEVDNSFKNILELHPAIASHPISGSTIMADLLAYIQMGYTTNLNGDRPIDTIFVHPSEKNDVSFAAKAGNWLRNFGIICGLSLTAALAFRFCDLGSCLGAYIPCLRYCNPFSWLAAMPRPTRDVEANHPEVPHSSAPVTIVNVQTQTRVEPPNRVPDLDILRPPESRRDSRDNRQEIVRLLQTQPR
jgi:hypothetical protein